MSDNEASSPNHRESSHESQRSRSHAKKKPRGHSESRALSEETGSDRGKTRSRTGSISPVRSRSRSSKRSRSRGSRSRRRRSYSRSRSRSYSKKYKRRSRSRSRKKYRSRSRSYSYSRSRGRDYYRSRSRSPLSNRRRHVGSRENPPSGRCLGVFGMSLYTRERDLKEVFSRYGKVEQVNIVYDQTGRSRGFAFVYFENSEDAQEARERCNGSEVDGRRIRVDFSITQRAHTPTPGVYMGKPTNSRYNRRSSSPYRHNRYSRSKSRSYSRSPRRY